MLHIQDVLLGAKGRRPRAVETTAVLNPLQDAINIFQPIFLKTPKQYINHHNDFILNVLIITKLFL